MAMDFVVSSVLCIFLPTPTQYSGKRGGQNLRKKENGVRRSRDQKIKGIVVRVIERLYLGCLGGIGKEVKPKQG